MPVERRHFSWSLPVAERRLSAAMPWEHVVDTLGQGLVHLDLPSAPASTFTLFCHAPVAPGEGMIESMDGGMFLYLYPVPDPTSTVTSVALITQGHGLGLVLRQPRGALVVADYLLTAVVGEGTSAQARFTVSDYADERTITTATGQVAALRGDPSGLHFSVDAILPNATHQLLAVPEGEAERWVLVNMDFPASTLVFVSQVTVHVA